jgi:hypothetical protein
MKQKSITSKLVKGLLACGAAVFMTGSVNAQIYVPGGTAAIGSTTVPANGYVGIGTDTPFRQFSIDNAVTAAGGGTANTWFSCTNVDGVNVTSAPGFQMRRARDGGDAQTPVGCVNGDRVGFFLAAGHDGSNYRNAAGITFYVDAAVSPGTMPVNFVVETGAPTRLDRMIIDSDGGVWFDDLWTGSNVGDVVMIGAGGYLTTGAGGSGGGGTWTSPTITGTGMEHIWYMAGTAAADTHAVAVSFSLEQDNSYGISSWYNGAAGDVADPVAIYGEADASSTTGYGIGVYGMGGWAGVWGMGGTWGVFSDGDAMVQGDLTVTGTVTSSSDRRLKVNAQPMQDALSKLMELKPQSYQYRTNEYPTMNLAEGTQFGFIAQELQEVYPTLVKEVSTYTNKDKSTKFDFLSVNYTGLIPVMVSAIQQQQTTIENMTERLDQIEELLKKKVSSDRSAELNTVGNAELFNSRPNPATDVAQIPFKVNSDNAMITIFDAATGRQVRSYNVSGEGQVSVSGLAAGHYTYVLTVDNVRVASKKLVFVK